MIDAIQGWFTHNILISQAPSVGVYSETARLGEQKGTRNMPTMENSIRINKLGSPSRYISLSDRRTYMECQEEK